MNEDKDGFRNTQAESILNSFLSDIAGGKTEELVKYLRQEVWGHSKLISLKKITDKKIDEAYEAFKNTPQIGEKIRIFEKITNLTTLRFRIQIVLNEKPVLKRQSIPPRNLK